MALLLFVANEGQLHGPIVRQIERAPFRVIKFCRGKLELAAFGEVSLAHAKAQIAQGVGAMPLKKLPAKVEQEMLTGSYCRQSLSRRHAGIGCKQRVGTAHRSCDEG